MFAWNCDLVDSINKKFASHLRSLFSRLFFEKLFAEIYQEIRFQYFCGTFELRQNFAGNE